MSRLLAAPDKFRGTASASQIAAAMTTAARAAGWDAGAMPISDGGEGLLDCFGGPNRQTVVTGPLGAAVEAGWRLDANRAVIEMATASGLALVGEGNDPLAATTRGTGELVRAAIEAGAGDIVVGAGGSATTDGGRGALEVLQGLGPFDGSRGIRVVIATDVRTRFVDAAATFAPQKGADGSQVAELTLRLERIADHLERVFGTDVRSLEGAGAAGGLAGGLAALGATIRSGFDVVAEHLRIPDAVRGADLVLTGEGRLDATTLHGKAPGALAALCARIGVPVVVVAGQVAAGFQPPFRVVDLSAVFGARRALTDVLACVESTVRDVLAETGRG